MANHHLVATCLAVHQFHQNHIALVPVPIQGIVVSSITTNLGNTGAVDLACLGN